MTGKEKNNLAQGLWRIFNSGVYGGTLSNENDPHRQGRGRFARVAVKAAFSLIELQGDDITAGEIDKLKEGLRSLFDYCVEYGTSSDASEPFIREARAMYSEAAVDASRILIELDEIARANPISKHMLG